ncbi:MAG: hypothetical protein CO189_08540 [candidate division Zixibacteria bacterium CG_4_9_14_3_um_filter_46_8]|nr:MAG: hypothetical protein CO189_08540 [candidate division Zixibacteria bacterium CG_4_9_14_3_um_filter_46_8]
MSKPPQAIAPFFEMLLHENRPENLDNYLKGVTLAQSTQKVDEQKKYKTCFLILAIKGWRANTKNRRFRSLRYGHIYCQDNSVLDLLSTMGKGRDHF